MTYNKDYPPDWLMAVMTLAFAISTGIIIWTLVVTN